MKIKGQRLQTQKEFYTRSIIRSIWCHNMWTYPGVSQRFTLETQGDELNVCILSSLTWKYEIYSPFVPYSIRKQYQLHRSTTGGYVIEIKGIEMYWVQDINPPHQMLWLKIKRTTKEKIPQYRSEISFPIKPESIFKRFNWSNPTYHLLLVLHFYGNRV